MKTIIESSGRMHNPAHPGKILKEMYIGPLGVTITQTADALGVSRKHVSGIVNGRVHVSPDMAARLAGVFGTEPDIWINLQAQYDLWQAARASEGQTPGSLINGWAGGQIPAGGMVGVVLCRIADGLVPGQSGRTHQIPLPG
jgi:addiction module HigA family antidote